MAAQWRGRGQRPLTNHRHQSILGDVIAYSRRFTENVYIAAPFAAPGVIQYSSAGFLAQGAIVEYLRTRTDLNRDHTRHRGRDRNAPRPDAWRSDVGEFRS